MLQTTWVHGIIDPLHIDNPDFDDGVLVESYYVCLFDIVTLTLCWLTWFRVGLIYGTDLHFCERWFCLASAWEAQYYYWEPIVWRTVFLWISCVGFVVILVPTDFVHGLPDTDCVDRWVCCWPGFGLEGTVYMWSVITPATTRTLWWGDIV